MVTVQLLINKTCCALLHLTFQILHGHGSRTRIVDKHERLCFAALYACSVESILGKRVWIPSRIIGIDMAILVGRRRGFVACLPIQGLRCGAVALFSALVSQANPLAFQAVRSRPPTPSRWMQHGRQFITIHIQHSVPLSGHESDSLKQLADGCYCNPHCL